jgi:hypothetical protein
MEETRAEQAHWSEAQRDAELLLQARQEHARDLRRQLREVTNALRRADEERSQLRRMLTMAHAQLAGAVLVQASAPEGEPGVTGERPLGFRGAPSRSEKVRS